MLKSIVFFFLNSNKKRITSTHLPRDLEQDQFTSLDLSVFSYKMKGCVRDLHLLWDTEIQRHLYDWRGSQMEWRNGRDMERKHDSEVTGHDLEERKEKGDSKINSCERKMAFRNLWPLDSLMAV